MSYVLIAVAFSASISATPVAPAVSTLGEFNDSLACTHAAQLVASIVERGPALAYARTEQPQPTMVLQCVPYVVPAQCAASPEACRANDVAPLVTFQEASP
jgi:hypothetical protein